MADIQDGADDAQVFCPVCNKSNRAGQKFCRHCGAGIAAAAAAPSAAVPELGCLACGTANKAEAMFCRACGESLTPAIAEEPELESGPEPEFEQAPAQEQEPEIEPDGGAPWLRGALVESGAISLLKRKAEEAAAPPGRARAASWAISLLKRKAKAALAGHLMVGAVGLILALLLAGAYIWFGGKEQGGTRYLLSDVSGYEAPKPNAKSGDRLSYGQSVQVEPTDTDGWLRVVDGPYKGLFLPGTLLGREAPPQIDKSGAGLIASPDGMQLHVEPDETSEVVGSIPGGSSRFAQGLVQGRDGRAWFVFLIDEDSLPRPAFGQRDSAPSAEQAAATPTPSVESESPISVETTDTAVAAESPMDSCARIRRKLDRFRCQDPGLINSQAEFSSAYSRAAARFGQAGQTLQPMARFAAPLAARIEQCGSPQCARARYREQTSLLDSLQPAARSVPAPVFREAARGATPRGNPGSWIRSADYPARALRAGEEGTVRFNLTIGPNGEVTACQIIGSSGYPALDEATCSLVSRRARFNPAVDSTGSAVEGRYANAVRWRLPE